MAIEEECERCRAGLDVTMRKILPSRELNPSRVACSLVTILIEYPAAGPRFKPPSPQHTDYKFRLLPLHHKQRGVVHHERFGPSLVTEM